MHTVSESDSESIYSARTRENHIHNKHKKTEAWTHREEGQDQLIVFMLLPPTWRHACCAMSRMLRNVTHVAQCHSSKIIVQLLAKYIYTLKKNWNSVHKQKLSHSIIISHEFQSTVATVKIKTETI